ncbi:MBL fold metallo-hydrolase [Chromobacterium sp. S0633]|uniref:MBL fold metallo-hydrolase n=1 Tax=Chromobacterium sp. S0633 TaxID=2957805 RepID=UPI00209D9C19|nr:MBL fold metallo-hydrolase [Chromobacterium sp. S0633]MCP1289984.1 MBL fold metallo-hydrolase [Chromobacterium sp. S0633]
MRVTVLAENHSLRPDLIAEPGLALLIEDGPHRILFDTGRSDALLRNASQLGVDLAALSQVVLSHGHYDHSGGLPALSRLLRQRAAAPLPLLAHPEAFRAREARLGPITLRKLGSPLAEADLQASFELQLHARPHAFADRYVFLGQIPRRRHAEGRGTLGRLVDASGHRPDPVADDSALVYRGEQGLIVFSGCAHSGIRHIVDYAREVCAEPRVHAVIGGFHLRSAAPWRVWRTRRYFQQLAPEGLYACHCTGYARHALARQHPIAAGSQLSFD